MEKVIFCILQFFDFSSGKVLGFIFNSKPNRVVSISNRHSESSCSGVV